MGYSNLSAYLEENIGIHTCQLTPYVSRYGASLMIGRWAGAAGASEIGPGAKRMLTLILPLLAFGVFLAMNAIARYEVTQFFGYAAIIVLMILATLASRGNPARMLLHFSLCAIVALVIGSFIDGKTRAMAFRGQGVLHA